MAAVNLEILLLRLRDIIKRRICQFSMVLPGFFEISHAFR